MKEIIPVVVINDANDTIKTLSALREGGINCAEITFRTACAREAIEIGVKAFPDMNIGAGTVINREQAEQAVKAGARFLVSPGVVTPTEIMHAISFGYTILKFFPAGVFGGLKALKALSAAFPQVRFIPTGGVDLSNIKEFLEFDKIFAIGGSFMMKGDIVANCKEIKRICES